MPRKTLVDAVLDDDAGAGAGGDVRSSRARWAQNGMSSGSGVVASTGAAGWSLLGRLANDRSSGAGRGPPRT
jgi:hypothetical protein